MYFAIDKAEMNDKKKNLMTASEMRGILVKHDNNKKPEIGMHFICKYSALIKTRQISVVKSLRETILSKYIHFIPTGNGSAANCARFQIDFSVKTQLVKQLPN